jgi:AcrR family transcriptional regulator
VSKGGFYWHFADRKALLDEMLDTWEQAGTEDVISRGQAAAPGGPAAHGVAALQMLRLAVDRLLGESWDSR